MTYNLVVVRELILAAFGDEEFLIFCADYFPTVRQQFTAGQTEGQRVQLLVEHAERHGLLADLLAEIRTANSYQYNRFAPQLGSPEGSPPLGIPASAPKISLAKLPSTSPDLFGRERELALLDDAWADPKTHVLIRWRGAAWARPRW